MWIFQVTLIWIRKIGKIPHYLTKWILIVEQICSTSDGLIKNINSGIFLAQKVPLFKGYYIELNPNHSPKYICEFMF